MWQRRAVPWHARYGQAIGYAQRIPVRPVWANQTQSHRLADGSFCMSVHMNHVDHEGRQHLHKNPHATQHAPLPGRLPGGAQVDTRHVVVVSDATGTAATQCDWTLGPGTVRALCGGSRGSCRWRDLAVEEQGFLKIGRSYK